MAEHDLVARGRSALLREFRWHEGHADVWSAFESTAAFRDIVAGLAALAAPLQPTRVAGIESRGFLLGGAVAIEIGAGFQAIRKSGGLFAGPKDTVRADADYRGVSHDLRMRATLLPHDRVVLVDDWVERGSQAQAARTLVERAGATWLGVVAMVDDTDQPAREGLGALMALTRSSELSADGH